MHPLIRAFVLGIRPQTLSASLIPILQASVWAFYQKNFLDVKLLFWILLSGGLIQCTVNLFNDAIDFKTGTDTPQRKGPPRLTREGILSYKQVLSLGFFCGGLAFCAGIPLILRGGWPIFIIGTSSLFLCYFYSAPPWALVRQGLSEIFVILFFGFIAVGGTYYLHTLEWEESLPLLGLQCGLWALSILIINHLRDEEEDRKSLRNNLIVRWGREMGLLELVCVQAFIYLLSFYWMSLNLKAGFFTFFLMPFSIFLVYKVCVTKPSPCYNKFLFLMSLLYTSFGLFWVIGFIF